MRTQEDVSIRIDPSTTHVLGVFDDIVHLKATLLGEEDYETIVVLTPKKEYLRIWSLWLDGKQRICNSYDHYCGVLGEFDANEIIETEDEITLYEWEDDDTEDGKDIEIKARVFIVPKFDNRPDFEHG